MKSLIFLAILFCTLTQISVYGFDSCNSIFDKVLLNSENSLLVNSKRIRIEELLRRNNLDKNTEILTLFNRLLINRNITAIPKSISTLRPHLRFYKYAVNSIKDAKPILSLDDLLSYLNHFSSLEPIDFLLGARDLEINLIFWNRVKDPKQSLYRYAPANSGFEFGASMWNENIIYEIIKDLKDYPISFWSTRPLISYRTKDRQNILYQSNIELLEVNGVIAPDIYEEDAVIFIQTKQTMRNNTAI
jgi:hypothetical protein